MLLQWTVATVYFQQTEHGNFEHVIFSYLYFSWFWHASRKLSSSLLFAQPFGLNSDFWTIVEEEIHQNIYASYNH